MPFRFITLAIVEKIESPPVAPQGWLILTDSEIFQMVTLSNRLGFYFATIG